MSRDRLRIEYATLVEVARSFNNESHDVATLIHQIAISVEELIGQGWAGQAAYAFSHEFQETLVPATTKLSRLLADVGNVLLLVIRNFQDADQQAVALFRNGQYGTSSSVFLGAAGLGQGTVGTGYSVDIAKYTNGVDGWSIIRTDGSQGFTPDELLVQQGDTCSIYGPLNFLVASGYDISQKDADRIAAEISKNKGWWQPDLTVNPKATGAPTLSVSEDVIKKYTSDYKRADFRNDLMQVNKVKAEKFLIKTVQRGNPVMVSMQVDDSFGLGSGGHAATVIGVKTGADKRLQTVLVATNWSGNDKIYEVPAKKFMKDWTEQQGGEHIIITRDPFSYNAFGEQRPKDDWMP
jgi:WXG100 family type VII secretion target